jgi:hypothetical protein
MGHRVGFDVVGKNKNCCPSRESNLGSQATGQRFDTGRIASNNSSHHNISNCGCSTRDKSNVITENPNILINQSGGRPMLIFELA